jgi:hypothetical protein
MEKQRSEVRGQGSEVGGREMGSSTLFYVRRTFNNESPEGA